MHTTGKVYKIQEDVFFWIWTQLHYRGRIQSNPTVGGCICEVTVACNNFREKQIDVENIQRCLCIILLKCPEASRKSVIE